jgi:hypothetical protein
VQSRISRSVPAVVGWGLWLGAPVRSVWVLVPHGVARAVQDGGTPYPSTADLR